MDARSDRYHWLWDVNMENSAFDGLLSGQGASPQYDTRWALLRLIEYAPYAEIKRLLPRAVFLSLWPDLAGNVRSPMRRDGMNFIYRWLRDRQESHG